jgi:hypothetical protein
MSLIGSIFKDVGNACKDVVEGAAHVVEGVAHTGKGLIDLNPKEMASGVGSIVTGAFKADEGAETLTPEGLAATTIMEGGVAAVHAMMPKDESADSGDDSQSA